MKKGKNRNLKFSEYDRIQGLIRSNKFREDVETVCFPFPGSPNTKEFSHKNAVEFTRKYHILLPPNRDAYKTLDECIEQIQQFYKNHQLLSTIEGDFVARVVPVEDAEFVNVDEPDSLRKERIEENPQLDEGDILPMQKYNKHPLIKDGRYLTIEINLTKTFDEIEKEVRDTIRRFRKTIKKTHGRKTETRALKQTIWEIYDMHVRDGLSFSEIAKKISGRNGNDDDTLNACKKAVEYAYKKACKIVTATSTSVLPK